MTNYYHPNAINQPFMVFMLGLLKPTLFCVGSTLSPGPPGPPGPGLPHCSGRGLVWKPGALKFLPDVSWSIIIVYNINNILHNEFNEYYNTIILYDIIWYDIIRYYINIHVECSTGDPAIFPTSMLPASSSQLHWCGKTHAFNLPGRIATPTEMVMAWLGEISEFLTLFLSLVFLHVLINAPVIMS